MSTHIAIIDYGMGNLHSVASALHKVAPHIHIQITDNAQTILNADKVIFPGVGAIRDCMHEIKARALDAVIKATLNTQKPMLAICVGLQSLMEFSEENGGVNCLAHFPGKVRAFAADPAFNASVDESAQSGERLKVPHMGWNQVQQTLDHPLWHNIPNASRFYFVHGFCVPIQYDEWMAGRCHYGIDFCAALARDNLFATQFHPEKSHDCGLQLLKNFVAWQG